MCEDAEAEAEAAGGTDLKTRTPHNFVGKKEKNNYGYRVAMHSMVKRDPKSISVVNKKVGTLGQTWSAGAS